MWLAIRRMVSSPASWRWTQALRIHANARPAKPLSGTNKSNVS
jgi:hypothetical protein